MATVSVTIPDAIAPRVLNAICTAYNYDAAKDGTKPQFAKAVVARFLQEVTTAVEANAAAEAARKTAAEAVASEVAIT